MEEIGPLKFESDLEIWFEAKQFKSHNMKETTTKYVAKNTGESTYRLKSYKTNALSRLHVMRNDIANVLNDGASVMR